MQGSPLACPQNLAQGLAHFQSSVVADESLRPEAIHEKIDTRAGRANHFCQNLVTQNRNLGNRWPPFCPNGRAAEGRARAVASAEEVSKSAT